MKGAILTDEVFAMAEGVECWVETGKGGVKMCGVHKQPLQDMSVLEQIPMGEGYSIIKEAWRCPVSGQTPHESPPS
jgi:hypothetical protein